MTSYSSQFDPINPHAPFIWHGGDYNPEQWPPETWDTDMELMRQSHFNRSSLLCSAKGAGIHPVAVV
jgi:beta-galactosidase GanA